MFGKSKDDKAPTILLEPKKVELSVSDEERNSVDKYHTVAQDIEFHPAALIAVDLKIYLKDRFGYAYDRDEVYDFLNKKYGRIESESKDSPGWEWCCLTKADLELAQKEDLRHNFWRIDGYTVLSGNLARRVYQKLVPIEVLEMVRHMKKRFPTLTFWVSDICKYSPRPDPFLMVCCYGLSQVIIAHWDEPGFVVDEKN